MSPASDTVERASIADTGEPILQCRELSRIFKIGMGLFSKSSDLLAVDRVDLYVRKGQTLAIVGESGSGKTTLGRMLLGILPASKGEILLHGRPVREFDRRRLARMVQPIFQDPYSSLNPRKTIGQTIEAPLIIHGVSSARDRLVRVREMMDSVGLASRLIHSYGNQLSGGQRQRVAIARALIMRPEIVICDEPTSALDVSVQAQILNLLVDLRSAYNLTYVFISHDLGIVEYIADTIAVMYLGQIVEQGRAAEILHGPRHPYTKALLGSVLTPDPSRGLPDLFAGAGFADVLNPPSGCRFHPRCPECRPACKEREPENVSVGRTKVKCSLVVPA